MALYIGHWQPGYGPIRLRCGILEVFRTVFASFLSLLALVMIVCFRPSAWLWFRGCLFRLVRVFYGLCRGLLSLTFAHIQKYRFWCFV